MAQGEAVLRDIAVHPATATYVATKLARHFIADEPPPEAVARIARAFRDSGGHLPTVYAALLDCPEAWQQPLAKLKSPIEYVVSCLRALPGLRAADPRGLYGTLRGMGQRPFFAPSPQGWPDTAAAWAGGDALWKRIEWAGIVAARIGSRVDPLRLADASYGPALGAPTRRAIARAESRQQGTGALARQPGISAEVGMKTRRQALRMFGGTAALIGLPGLTFSAAPPEPRANDRRLVFMFLRGGMDGLSAVAPFGDSQYAAQRGPLAVLRLARPAARSISTATSA